MNLKLEVEDRSHSRISFFVEINFTIWNGLAKTTKIKLFEN